MALPCPPILEGGLDAYVGLDDPIGDRNDLDRRTSTGSNLRSEFSDLPADLWHWRQLHRLRIYNDASVQSDGVRPCSPMHHQPIFLRGQSLPAAIPRLLEPFPF